jgi:hypothetical protein
VRGRGVDGVVPSAVAMGCSRARTVYIWPTIRTPSAVSSATVGAAGAQEGGWSGVLGAAVVCRADVVEVGWDMGTPEGGV